MVQAASGQMTQRFVHCIEFVTLLRPTIIGHGAAGFNGLHETLLQPWKISVPGIWRKALHDCLEIRSLGFHFERIQAVGDLARISQTRKCIGAENLE